MTRCFALLATALACAACAADHDQPVQPATASAPGAASGCIAAGGGYLHAQLRGAVVADVNWSNAEMQCAGSPRPDGKGLRLTFAGKSPGTAGAPGRQLRFIFGVEQHDTAAGKVQALPTNLTVILEGQQQLYATRGADQCAVESLDRSPLDPAGATNRVHARGYCLGPATNMTGDARLLVPTFEFTGVADAALAP